MDVKQFIAEFGYIANAQGGVKRLRKMIYNLAITGDLINFNEAKGNAKELLDSITEEKESRIKNKNFKRSPKLEKLNAEIPAHITLPSHWVWTDLASIGEISPKNIAEDEVNASFIPMSGISELHSGALLPESRKWGNIKKGYTNFANGDVVVAKITPCFENGKSAVIQGLEHDIGAGTTEIHVVRPLPGIEPKYIYIFLRSPYFMIEGELNMTGTAGQKRLPSGFFASTPMPLPPLDEQNLIVDKVDELMALCDHLEIQQKKKRELQNNLRKATLQAVSEANSPFELKQHWQRLQNNFDQLFSKPGDVISIKGLILDLAVTGKLLPLSEQNTALSGRDLLKDIEHARNNWLKEALEQELKEAKTMVAKLRKQKVSLPEDELPNHWEWGTFLQLSQAVVDCHNKTAPYVGSGIHLVRTTDIRNGKMDLRNTKKISEETYDYWSRRMPPHADDILFTREAPMGEAAIVPEGELVCLGQRTMLLRLFPELFSNKFLLYVIQSPSFQARMVEAAIGMTVKHLRVGGVEDLFVPIPPKQEQVRIVANLDDFFKICEMLEKQLSRENKIAKNFAIASVASLTGINISQEEAPLKTPQTELVAPVKLGSNKPDNKDAAPLASLLVRQNGEMNANDLWQRFGGDIDAFYAQLKTEVAHGWIIEPTQASMLEKDAAAA